MYLQEHVNLYIWQKTMLKSMFTLKKGTIRQKVFALVKRATQNANWSLKTETQVHENNK